MPKNWKRLAGYAARRRAELGLSQIEVAQRGPLSLDRVQAIEGEKSTKYRLGTLMALERALQWTEGSVDRILEGGEPVAAPSRIHLAEAERSQEDQEIAELRDLIERANQLLARLDERRRDAS